ncbi:MAG TPA: uroporphyrinogen decarboxylase family protein [bacterium]|nr:uroporphyrinogen decarboxylase family protein [bacterium]
MKPAWHVAIANISICRYARVSYRQYYSDPAVMLQAQKKAAAFLERRFGLKDCLKPFVDAPGGCLASVMGLRTIFPEENQLPCLNVTSPVIRSPQEIDNFSWKDLKADFNISWRIRAWRYLKEQGYPCRIGGHDGSIMTTAGQVTGNLVFLWLKHRPEAGRRLLDLVTQAHFKVEALDRILCGAEDAGYGYVGDDFAGLVSPEMFRTFLIPCYQKIYAGRAWRFFHSELLTCEHLRLAKDYLNISEFHGAGCARLTFEEMRQVMGEQFWVQLTPTELFRLSPAQIKERIKVLAQSGARVVQIYPGQDTPDQNLEAALEAVRKECPGGQL